MGYGYCRNCEELVPVEPQDFGIGGYEYWGARGFHKDIRPACSECGDEILQKDLREE